MVYIRWSYLTQEMPPRKRKRKNRQESPKLSLPSKQSYDEDTKARIMLYSTLIIAFIFSCICTGIIWYVLIREKEPIEYVTIKSVDIINLPSNNSPFATDCINRHKPVVIKNSVINKWNAFKLWTPKYLETKFDTLSGIYENNNKWFGPYYDTTKPLSEVSRRVNNYKTNVTLSSTEFFNRIQYPISGRYHYYTGGIDELGDWAISHVKPINELLSPNPFRSSINIWMGQPHVIAHCHFDGYHNFYAQLYGRKKFTMFDPGSFTGLYPFPYLHPSHAQAQVNLSNTEDVKLFPLVQKLESYVVILEPGDLLYMPPLWFHHVEALDVSISVNVWTDTKQTNIMEQVFNINIPFNDIDWHGEHLKAIGSSVVFYKLVQSVCTTNKCVSPDSHVMNDLTSPDKDPLNHVMSPDKYLVYRLWSTRYKRLMETGVMENSFSSKRNAQRKSILCEIDQLPGLFYQGVAQKLAEIDIEKYLSSVTTLINKLPQDTWEVWFGNYLEYLSFNIVELRNIGLFLKYYDTCIQYF